MRFSHSKKKQHIIRLSLNFTKTKCWIFHFQKLKLKVLQLKIRKQCNLKEKDKSGVETKRRSEKKNWSPKSHQSSINIMHHLERNSVPR
jgi:hypothetical protein